MVLIMSGIICIFGEGGGGISGGGWVFGLDWIYLFIVVIITDNCLITIDPLEGKMQKDMNN